MKMADTAINPPSLTDDGGQVSDLLLEVLLEVGFPSTSQPLEISESYFLYKTRMASELLKVALEDFVQPPSDSENIVAHSEEEPLGE